jgi:hypothetical protein
MGYDSLVQIGAGLQKSQDDIKHITNRVSYNLPIIEKSFDRVGALYKFKMEFYTYTNNPAVTLDIRFAPKFISPFYEEA